MAKQTKPQETVTPETTNTDFQVLTVERAAALLGLKPTTIRKHYREGKLKGYAKAGRLYFLTADVISWLKNDK